MKVLLVTSDRERCGIREYGRMLKQHLLTLGVEVEEFPHPDRYALSSAVHDEGLDLGGYDLVHVNHHAALHASWTDERVKELGDEGVKVVVTQHDTFETVDIMRERGMPLFHSADAWVMHEEVAGINYRAWGEWKRSWVRQGVLAPAAPPYFAPPLVDGARRPCLGLFGFDFPWKNFDLAIRLAGQAGWQVLVLSPGAAPERIGEWSQMGAVVGVVTEYLISGEVVRYLAGCDATAFLYTCGNSGTSGAIRLGLAARRPLVAFRSRQFRDLFSFPGIYWADGEEQVGHFLEIAKGPEVARLMSESVSWIADTCSWERVAQHYKEVYERVLA